MLKYKHCMNLQWVKLNVDQYIGIQVSVLDQANKGLVSLKNERHSLS